MTIPFDFAARVVLSRPKAPPDRLRPDDSILALVLIFGRFDNEVERHALECLVSHAWSRGAVKDGAVQGNSISSIELQIKQLLKAVIPHDDDPAIGTPGLLDHSLGNHDSVVNNVAFLHREHAVDRQEPMGVDAHAVRQRRF